MQELKVVFVGFGTVGRGCARYLAANRRHLESSHGLRCKVVAITDLKAGWVENREGIGLAAAIDAVDRGGRLSELPLDRPEGRSSIEVIKASKADVLVESTWTNLKDGEPGLSHIIAALESGMDVVTSNKGPLALAFRRLKAIAKDTRRQLRFESTVMSGSPVFSMCEAGLAGARILRIRGILNGTTNYILTEMAAGKSYAQALRCAQELGYAEADPTGDVEGYDPAAKIAILANALMGADEPYAGVNRVGITSIRTEDIERAACESKRIKLIASASKSPDGRVELSVRPALIPETDILAHVSGIMNALQITTDAQPDVTIIGPGAGGDSAGYGLVNDLVSIHHGRLSS